MYQIIAQTPKLANELRRAFVAQDKARRAEIRRAKAEQGSPRYLVIDAGFPAIRYMVWDTVTGDNLRGSQLPGNPRHPWYVRKSAALRIADRLNKAAA